MALFLIYIIKSSICLTLFYLFFALVMRGSTLFRFNRMTLLVGTVICMLLPFFPVTVSEKQWVQVPMQTLNEILLEEDTRETVIPEEETTVPQEQEVADCDKEKLLGKRGICGFVPSVATSAGILYLSGMIITLGMIVFSFLRMWQIIRNAPRKKENGYWLAVVPHSIHSFSFGRYIVLSEEDYRKNSAVLVHEQMHLRYRHTWDSLWFMSIIILYWFNPVVWLMKSEMQQLHEFEADEGVIKHGIDATQYQLLLVRKAVGTRLYSMANGFNHCKLKKRITMMLKERTNGWARLKLLIVVPVAMGAMYVFARPEVKDMPEKTVPVISQESNEPQDLTAMKEFFGREIEKNKISPEEAEKEVVHRFYINQRNEILFDQTRFIKPNEILEVIAETFVNTAYKYKKENNKDVLQSLAVIYDKKSNEMIVFNYLRQIRYAFEKLPELAPEMGLSGSKEKWPMVVFFPEPKSFNGSR